MKRKYGIISLAFLLITAGNLAKAQTTDVCGLNVFPADAKKMQGMLKYTVNYAAAKPDSTAPLQTVVSVANVKTPPKTPSATPDKNDCVKVVFKDNSGVVQGAAVGSVGKGESAEFGTGEWPNGVPEFITVEYKMPSAVPTSENPEPVLSFEGRAEVYSKNPLLQVAAFLVGKDQITDIPVQKGSQATKGGN